MKIILLFVLVFIAGCEEPPPPALTLTPAGYEALPGWAVDDIAAVMPAFTRSCERIMKVPAERALGPLAEAGTYGDWQAICRDFLALGDVGSDDLRAFFEARFTPYMAAAGDEAGGLFTGYYEAHLRGSLARGGAYQTPLYKRPDDLVMVQLGEFRDDLKGRRIAGRVLDGRLRPYESRADIIAGDWPHNEEVLVWVDSPVDAFFVQIQGSGIVELEGGGEMRIGYAGQNGHPYFAIGRELINRGVLTKEEVSLQSIRTWLEANPDQAEAVMSTNASYVFFRALDGDGPLGAEGVALTAGRSLAVDRSLWSFGVPIWLQAEHPNSDKPPLQRLMIAQDTGGAIRGPVRGDVFWGYGQTAEHYAGLMKSRGRYWVLLPNTLSKTN